MMYGAVFQSDGNIESGSGAGMTCDIDCDEKRDIRRW